MPGVIVLGLILAWWILVLVGSRQVSSPVVEIAEVAVVEEQDTGLPEVASEPEINAADAAGVEALEQFKRKTRYPPTTRRIAEDSHDLLNPGARYERRHRLPGDNDDPNLDWEVLYTADRFLVRGKEPLLVSLQLWKKGKPVPPGRVSMVARAISAGKTMKPVTLVMRTDGNARTAVFTPNEHWPEYAGQVRVTTEFAADGLAKQSGSLDFFFTGADRIPALFTGKISDRLDNGDLVFNIEMDVKSAGLFRIDGNLFDSAGLPFGWARFEGTLPDGPVTVSLRYYGLLFHDAQAIGPYILKNLRGSRLRPGDIPHKEAMPEPASDYMTTTFYELNRFRTDVNSSPRRQKMIEMYEDAIRRGVKLTIPAYDGDG